MNSVTSITTKKEKYEIADAKARQEKLNIKDLPKDISSFFNNVGFIDKTVSDLINYYRKSEVYTKNEIDDRLAAKWDSKFVDELPTDNISTSTIYFVPRPKTEQEQGDSYNEYIYTTSWELIGNTFVDLSDYYKKSEVEQLISNAIQEEVLNRISSDEILQNNINVVQNQIDNVDLVLKDEISTRGQEVLRIDNNISTLTDNLSNEIKRATDVETAFSNKHITYDSHLSNLENPHNVTAEQIGLGNVSNVTTTNAITKNSKDNITSGAVYSGLSEKVDKIEGKELSDQNFTLSEKNKLQSLFNYNDTAISERIDNNKSAIDNLNADSDTIGSVSYKIKEAFDKITSIDFTIVTELPETGTKGVIYFVVTELTEGTNIYEEFVWVNNRWEQLNQTSRLIELKDYYKKSEANALYAGKNDKITITDNDGALTDVDSIISTLSDVNPTDMKRSSLSSLWTYIKQKMSVDGDAKSINGIILEVVE